MEQHRKAPRVSEGDQVRFAWEEFDVQHPKKRDLLTGCMRLVNPVSQGRVQYCARTSDPKPVLAAGAPTLTRCPYQESLLILPLLKVCHDAVHNVRLGREEVYSVDIAIGRAALFDLLDVWNQSGCCASARLGECVGLAEAYS